MRYWWVTQNKTSEEEIRGGYIWAPKVQKDGHQRAGYTNVSLVQRDDIIISFAQSHVISVGRALSDGYNSVKPHSGNAWDDWQSEGWRVDVDYTLAPNKYRPITDIAQIRPLLPEVNSPLIRSSGRGYQGMYLAAISKNLADFILEKIGITSLEEDSISLDSFEAQFLEDEKQIWNSPDIPDTTKERLIQSRVGQGLFRKRVKMFEQNCRVTGLSDDSFLIASHIKPWSKADDHERLDGNNGLLLSPHIDRLFDRGYMSFSQKGDVLLSGQLNNEVISRWSLDRIENVGVFTNPQEHFLKFHRDFVFVD